VKRRDEKTACIKIFSLRAYTNCRPAQGIRVVVNIYIHILVLIAGNGVRLEERREHEGAKGRLGLSHGFNHRRRVDDPVGLVWFCASAELEAASGQHTSH
jgi:hypothetical protein